MKSSKGFRFGGMLAGALLLIACGGEPEVGSPGSGAAERATIAVLGAGDFVPDRNAGRVGSTVGLPDTLASRMIEHLTNTKRFTPVERTALRRTINEQAFGQSLKQSYLDTSLDKAIGAMEEVEASTVAVTGTLADFNDLVHDFKNLGTTLGAQYIVLGNLEKLTGSIDVTEVPFTAGRTSTTRSVDARLQLRVIEVARGVVIGATSVRTRVSESVFEGKTVESDEYSFYDHLGALAATKVLDVTFPARVVSLTPAVISRGSIDGTAAGDEFDVSREGDEIRDGSGQVIARLKRSVARVRVVDAQDTVSIVEPVSGGALQLDDLAVRSEDTARNQIATASAEALGRQSGELPRLAVGLIKTGSTARTDTEDHTPVFTDTLISRLTQTKRFTLIDRQEVDQLLDEQLAAALAQNQDLPSAMGTLQGADYLAYGSVDAGSIRAETQTVRLPGSDRVIEQTNWYVSGNMRIVDARSGAVLESRKVSVVEKPGLNTSQQTMTTRLADAYAEQVVLMLMNAIYPIKVASVTSDGTAYINRGNDGGLAVGEVLDAYRPGSEITDPDTGISLGFEETPLGQVELFEVEDARSKGRAEVNLARGDILKRSLENRAQRAGARSGVVDTRSGAQLGGTPDKSQGKDTKFTVAIGRVKVNSAACAPCLKAGHVKRMTDDLMIKMTNTNRFRVMERQEVDQVLDEKMFEAMVSGGDMVGRLNEMLGADYLLHGEVTNFYIRSDSTHVAVLDETETRTTGVAEGMFRLVDVHTGAVVGADKVSYRGSAVNVTDQNRLISELLDNFTTEGVAAVVLRLFPIKVMGQTADGSVYVNRGEDAGLKVGQRFNVMRPGETMVDPDTGIAFGAAESLLGVAQVVSIEASRAVVRFEVAGQAASGDILRPAPPAPAPEAPPVRTPNF